MAARRSTRSTRKKHRPKWATHSSLEGVRVQLHPGLDAWMRGDKYGEITGFGRKVATFKVKLDKSGKTLLLPNTRFERIDHYD
jgi:hypothetical protein